MSPRLAGSHRGRRPPEIALTITEAATAVRALDAAIALIHSHLAAPCPACRHSENPCARHVADVATVRAYRELRAELGAKLPRSGDRWADLLMTASVERITHSVTNGQGPGGARRGGRASA
jgi:hypothetical protein